MAEAGSNLQDLYAACVTLLGQRTDLDQEIQNAVTTAIERYQPKVFLATQAESQFGTLAFNTNIAALPPNFENMTRLYYEYTNTDWVPLQKVDQSKIEDDNAQTNPPLTGPPIEFAIYQLDPNVGEVLTFFPYADMNYPLKAIYDEIIPFPATDTTSNYWTVEAASMIMYFAVGLIRQNVLRTGDLGIADFKQALIEYNKLKGRVEDVTAPHRARPVYL